MIHFKYCLVYPLLRFCIFVISIHSGVSLVFVGFWSIYLNLDTNFIILLIKKYHGTFQILLVAPHPSYLGQKSTMVLFENYKNTHAPLALGTFRVMFHQKSTCTPGPPAPGPDVVVAHLANLRHTRTPGHLAKK